MKRFFLMLLASCALSVFAETEIVNDITWSYQVSGEGTATLGAGTSPVTGALVIPAEIAGYVVTAIGDEAFYNCTGLTSVTIPSSVTAIGYSAFGACSQLTEVIFEGEPPTEAKNSSFPEVAGYYSVQHADAWAAVIQEGTWKRLTMGQKVVNVVFDANGGEGGETFTSAYGASVTEPTVMREGYTFLGWDKEVATVVSPVDVTYTAQWREGYVWDATKLGFYDSTGQEAVIEGEFTLMADFTMPNVTRMEDEIITFTAMKADAALGTIGLKDWYRSNQYQLTYATGTVSTPSTWHYSNVRLYNGGAGVNTVTISAFNPAGGAPTVTTFVVDFANGETSGVETIKQDAFFSEYGFSLKALTLGEGVQLKTAYLVLAPRHLQQTDKECFSINFAAWYYNEQSPVTGVAGLYAVEGWNNLALNENFAVALDMWDGASTTCVKVAETHAASNTHGWETASDAFLKSYLDDCNRSVKITLEDIPFSQYSVIVYTATDEVNARFKPVQINGVYYAGANTYTHGVGYAMEVSEEDKANGWGASWSHYARFGTNALRVDGLSGDLTIQGGEYSAKCRGCIAAIQVINTGDLSDEVRECRVGYDALGRTYSLVFRATDSGDWSTVNNWQTFMTGTTADGSKVEEWLDSINSKVPGVPQGNFLDTLLIDGALLSDNITVDEGYKLVEAPVLEGWAQVIGVANGAHLSVEGLLKLQADSDWRVDETSKMTIGNYNTSNPREGTHNILCLAEEGIEFKTNCNVSFNYALGKVGSVRYTNVSGVHTIQQLELDLGDSTKMGFEMKQRKLIGFTSASATFRAEGPTVTTTDVNVSAVMTKVPLRVGEYDFEVRADGYYVNYVAYGDNIRPVAQTTINRDANLSELKLTGGEMVVAELTLADGVTLTIDEDPVLAAIRLISAGDVAVTCSLETLTNIGGIVATGVQGEATYEAVGYYYEIPFAKLIGFDKIKKTGSVEWRPNDLSALKDYQLEVANGKMLVNTAMQTVVATAEKPVLVTGEGATLRFEGGNQNRMPADGYVKAEKGAKIELQGVNPFYHHYAPRVVLDEGILKMEATDGCHLKFYSVTMANGSEIQLSRTATAYNSEGLVLRTEDSEMIVTTGNNTIKYLDDGTATNMLLLESGIFDIAQGATLDVQVAVKTLASALTKRGEGTLIWNGTTTFPFVIEAGEIAFNADAQPTNAFSGTGVIVADGATLDLTKATITGCALAVRKNGVLILNQNQVGQMTVPTGSTLKVKVADYEALTLEGVTLAAGENVTFILPNGVEVEGEGNTLPNQPVYTYTATANEENLWSDTAKWSLGEDAIDAVPAGKVVTAVKVVLEGGNATLTMDVADVQLADLIIENGELTLAGEETLTVAKLASTHKVIVAGTLVLEGGSEEDPVTVANVLEVSGKLITKGYMNLSGANRVSASGMLEVATGVTSLNCEEQGLAGELVIAQDATCKSGKKDALKYKNNASPVVDVAGTLELTGITRWSFPTTSTMILREGAVLKGNGGEYIGRNQINYAYDWFAGGTINVLGNATIAGRIGAHEAGPLLTISIAREKKLTISGKLDGSVDSWHQPATHLKVTGEGTLSFIGENSTHVGGTTIDVGATVEVQQMDQLGFIGLVEVNGRLRVVNTVQVNHSTATSHMINDTTPRLVGTGVLEFAGTHANVLRNGFKTPLTFENNNTAGVVISNTLGMTIGSLAGNGKFRSDFGDNTNGADARVLTILQTKATTFTGTFDANSTTNSRRIHVVVDRAEGVEEGVDTTLTLGGTNSNDGVSMTVAEAGSVNVIGIWACPMTVAGTIRGEGQMATLTLCDGATLAGAVNVTGNVTLEGEIKVAHAQRIGDVVMTCANAAEINLAKLSPAPQGLKYVVNGNQIQLEEVGAYFVNGVDYATLSDAINAANELTEGDTTIVLYRATTLDESIQIDSAVTIDLAGQTLTENVGDDSNAGAFDVTATGLLTIKDTVGGGKIASNGGIVITNVGEVMIESGVILAGDDTAHDVAIYNLYHDASTYGKLEMANGEITSIWNCGEAEITAGEVTVINNRGALVITEGVSGDTILLQRDETIEVSNAGIVTAPAGLNVITDEEGYQVLYGEGQYTLDQIVVTTAFGLNFSHENGEGSKDAIVPANGVGVGFFTEKYAAPTYWRNGQSSAADQGDFILENGTLYRVYWTALGSYSSECGLDTDIKKLLHTYLDDRSHQKGNPGRVKASVTITNLPEDKKYAVALILAGDADNTTAMYNHKYSPVLINGQVYSYDAQANLLTGEAAQSATQWGNRSKVISEEGKLTIGTNVMFVEGLSGGVLSITSAMDEIGVSRLTIAGVQVWITNENVTPAASPISENAEAISVNFNTKPAGYAVAAEQSAGLYAVDGWNNTFGSSGELSTLNISNGESETTLPISLKFSSHNEHAWDSATEAYLKGYLDDCDRAYLDDCGRAPQVEVSNIPFETYSVIVYSATDTARLRFWPIQVNGTHYVGSSTYNPGVGYAASVERGSLPWGYSRNLTAVYGTNAIRVDGLTGETLTIKTGSWSAEIDARGGIAAIQIVNTGAPVMTEVQEIDWTEQGATAFAISSLADLITKPIVKLKVADGTTLVVDELLDVYTIKLVSEGDVTIKVTNLEEVSAEILREMFEAELVSGTVTYDYEETFGCTKDGVTYPLIFRGTTDADWATVTNWYTGTRTNSTETYWIPYEGTVAPGVARSTNWDAMLFDGELIGDNIEVQGDGYKTITTSTVVEGWTSRLGVMNGVHLKIESMYKLQGGGTWRIDETSKVTVMNKANPGNHDTNNHYHVDAEEGLVFVNMPMPGGTAYLGVKGSIKTGSFVAEQSIGEVILDLGDSSLLGKRTVSRRLYAFTAGTTFNVAHCTVKTTVDTITATKVETLENVGDYTFEKTSNGFYINYVAYAPKLPESVTGETAEWLQEVLAQAGVTSSEVTLADGVTAEMLEEARLLGVIPEVNVDGTVAEVAVATSFIVSDMVVDETTITLAVTIAVGQGELPETVTLGGQVALKVAQSLSEWTTVTPAPAAITMTRVSETEATVSVTYDRGEYKFFQVIVTP